MEFSYNDVMLRSFSAWKVRILTRKYQLEHPPILDSFFCSNFVGNMFITSIKVVMPLLRFGRLFCLLGVDELPRGSLHCECFSSLGDV